jgi:2-polyprenyl-3-methyl-5-hydroxy-6-metoxy-1,4-benzoquinol methylase
MIFDARSFWKRRFDEVGDVGYADKMLYKYDERLRYMAIIYAVSSLGLGEGARVLDIGCGTGRLAVELAKKSLSVTGIDLLNDAVRKAKQRAEEEYVIVDFVVGDIVNDTLGMKCFDLITSITVLQHITERAAFEKAVEVITDSVKFDGHILILEYSPLKCSRQSARSDFYMSARTRSEWIDVFSVKDAFLREVLVPQLGRRVAFLPSPKRVRMSLLWFTAPFDDSASGTLRVLRLACSSVQKVGVAREKRFCSPSRVDI